MARKGTMSFINHLTEMRRRLIRICLAVLCTSVASLVFTPEILRFLLAPYGNYLKVIGPTEGVSTYLRVAVACGVAAALPYILLEIWGFIAPGLLLHEKRYVYTLLPATLMLFLGGAAFAWFVVVPMAIRFLANFQPGVFQVQWTSERYIPFVTALLFWLGIAFELPVASYLLAKLHVVSASLLLRAWRYAIVVIAIAAAIITPTVDVFNLLLVAVPVVLLYFISILVAAVAGRHA